MAGGKWSNITLVNAVTTSGTDAVNGTGYDLGHYDEALVFLQVTAVTGTNPTLDVHLEGSWNGTSYVDFPTASAANSVGLFVFTQATAASVQMLRISNFGRWVRAVYLPGGTNTPTVTFSVFVVAKQHGRG